MSDEPMTLKERLRNPMWVSPPDIVGSASLSVDETRADMDEAANEIERLEKALELRNAEVVDALKWLPCSPPGVETEGQIAALEKMLERASKIGSSRQLNDLIPEMRALLSTSSRGETDSGSLAMTPASLPASDGRPQVAASVVERMILMPDGWGIKIGGRFDGWLMRPDADGGWVSVRKLAQQCPIEYGPAGDALKVTP